MTPFFSVVIPLYNKEAFIESTLQSVLQQSFDDFEIIIVNDGSTDKSLRCVEAINDSRITIHNISNSGLSIARNTGVNMATANHIAFIDADDFWKPEHLQLLHNLINKYPDCGLYSTGYTFKKTEKNYQRAIFNDLPKDFVGIVPDFFKHSLINCVAWVSAISIPKHIFNDLGYFDPEIFSEQDTDLYIRIALKYQVAIDNSCASAIYNRSMETSMSYAGNKKEAAKLLFTYKDAEANNPDLKKFLDYNRFSFIMQAKLNPTISNTQNLINDIDLNNLSAWQRILIKLPNYVVKLMYIAKTKYQLNTSFIFKPKD